LGVGTAVYLKHLPISDFPILKHIYENKASKAQKKHIKEKINSVEDLDKKNHLQALLRINSPTIIKGEGVEEKSNPTIPLQKDEEKSDRLMDRTLEEIERLYNS